MAEAARSAEVTHDQRRTGRRSSRAARSGAGGESEIRDYVERTFGYGLSGSIDALRAWYTFDATCQETVPAALVAFMDATDYEDAVRWAVMPTRSRDCGRGARSAR
jgi:ADP-ribosylglycohydrolase